MIMLGEGSNYYAYFPDAENKVRLPVISAQSLSSKPTLRPGDPGASGRWASSKEALPQPQEAPSQQMLGLHYYSSVREPSGQLGKVPVHAQTAFSLQVAAAKDQLRIHPPKSVFPPSRLHVPVAAARSSKRTTSQTQPWGGAEAPLLPLCFLSTFP